MAEILNPNVSDLTDYVEQKRLPLIAKSLITGKTVDLIQLETGVKQDTALNLLEVSPEFGDGSQCGFDAAGEVNLSQRMLEPVFMKVNMEFCDKNLLKKWASYEVNLAAGRETLPFAEKFMDEIANGIKGEIENGIWNGFAVGGSTTDGFLAILTDDGALPVDVTGMGAYEAIKAVYMTIPDTIVAKNDTVIFIGEDLYRTYIQDLIALNYYHYDPNYADGEYRLPGTNVRVIAVPGLTGSGSIVAGRLSNFFYGVGAEDDSETFDFWYSKDNRSFRLACNFAVAVQIAYPDECVLGTGWTA